MPQPLGSNLASTKYFYITLNTLNKFNNSIFIDELMTVEHFSSIHMIDLSLISRFYLQFSTTPTNHLVNRG